ARTIRVRGERGLVSRYLRVGRGALRLDVQALPDVVVLDHEVAAGRAAAGRSDHEPEALIETHPGVGTDAVRAVRAACRDGVLEADGPERAESDGGEGFHVEGSC